MPQSPHNRKSSLRNPMNNPIKLLSIMICVAAIVCGCCRMPCRRTVSDTSRIEHSTRHIERLRDTTIHVQLPDERREQVIERDSSRLETSIAYSEVRIDSSGRLHHILSNKPSLYPVTVTVRETSDSEVHTTGEIRTERLEIPVERPLKWTHKTLIYCGIIFLTTMIVCIAVFIARRLR